jgi:head-tail adaptor
MLEQAVRIINIVFCSSDIGITVKNKSEITVVRRVNYRRHNTSIKYKILYDFATPFMLIRVYHSAYRKYE